MTEAPTAPRRQYKYYDLVMAAFVCVLLCSNLIGVRKYTQVDLPFFGTFEFAAGNLFFPISYLFGDILTEVYGYARSRRVVWAGFVALAYASFESFVITTVPPSAGTVADEPFIQWAFGSTYRIAIASLIAYFCGEFVNSFVLAKLKVLTRGRYLWVRTIGSTMCGEAVDSLLFLPIALYGVLPNDVLVNAMISAYIIKVTWEIAATPVTYRIVKFFKEAEHEDYYDVDTKFTPFSLKV